VSRLDPAPLPELAPDRLIARIAEAMQAGKRSAALRRFPPWTQRVMRILRDQFVPREYASILTGDTSVFAEGVAVAWAAKARDLVPAAGAGGSGFARQLAQQLSLDATAAEVAAQVESGTFAASDELQRHVMSRLFSRDYAVRRAFAEGLAIGNRLPELLDQQVKRSTTDATAIYLTLWLYWPEIARLRSIAEVARALHPFFAHNPNLAGVHWDERIRKLSNRLGLSFRAAQARGRRLKESSKGR
jgi:hypothetical protein